MISNPLDLRDDATVDRYIIATWNILGSHDHDALLILPRKCGDCASKETAARIIAAIAFSIRRSRWLTIFTNWAGEYSSTGSPPPVRQAGILLTAHRKVL